MNSILPAHRSDTIKTLFIIIFSITLLAACSTVRTRSILGGRLNITVAVSEKVNQNNPVALDLLLVHDEQLLSSLLKLNARQWFTQKDQIMRDFIKGEGLDCWSWEWVPGQNIPVQKLPLKPDAKAGIIFAAYLSPGAHRVRFNPFEDIVIRLEEETFFVTIND